MRITFVITGLGMGGAEVQVCTLAEGFVRRGADVQIVAMMSTRAPHPQLGNGAIEVRTLGMTRGRWSFGDLVRYVKVVRAFHPDIVHSQMFHANVLARVGRPFVGTPLICTSQNTVESPERAKKSALRTRSRELMYRLSDPLCELTTQVSAEGAQRYVAVGATPASKMRFVPNAIDCARFSPDPDLRRRVREELRVGEAFTWLSIGRLEEQKDPLTLLRAFQTASAASPCLLLVAGAGSLEKQVHQEATRLGLESKVRFLGLRSDVRALVSAADAFVLSSRHEGLPLVVLEAGAAGLPVVATFAGSEAMLPGQSGWVVPPEDPPALGERMAALMALSPERRREMGERGRSFVTSRFALEPVLETWEEIYASALAKRGARSTWRSADLHRT